MLRILHFFILFTHFNNCTFKLFYWFQVLLFFLLFFIFLLVLQWIIFPCLMLFLTDSFFNFYFIDFIKWQFLNLIDLVINFNILIILLRMHTIISWYRFSFIQIALLSLFIWMMSFFISLSLIPPIFLLVVINIFYQSLWFQFLIVLNIIWILLTELLIDILNLTIINFWIIIFLILIIYRLFIFILFYKPRFSFRLVWNLLIIFRFGFSRNRINRNLI